MNHFGFDLTFLLEFGGAVIAMVAVLWPFAVWITK